MDQREQGSLLNDFAAWLAARGSGADVGDLVLLLEWKRDCADGEQYHWRLQDVDDFLLDYCPRKLSVPPELAVSIPSGVAETLTFLGERGLLGRGSDSAGRLAAHARGRTEEHLTRMADPSLFGMAKSVFAAGGGLDPDFDAEAPGAMDRLVERANRVIGSARRTVGPVRMPGEAQRRESAAAAPALDRFRRLHEACAAPGLKLTATGNPTLADARRLVELLDTGDITDPTYGGQPHRLRSAGDLRGLRRWVEWAVAARVVRRHKGRLVAVAAWHTGARDPLTAFDRAVDALQQIGPVSIDQQWEVTSQLAGFIESGTGHVLAELLGTGEHAEVDGICELVEQAASRAFRMSPLLGSDCAGSLARDLLDRLADCGVVALDGETLEPGEFGIPQRRGGTVRLTPAGVPVAARLARQLGIEVLERPEPGSASAEQLAGLVGLVDEEQWCADARAWAAARRTDDAAAELVRVLADRPDHLLLTGLELVHAAFGSAAGPAARSLLGGPRDAIVVVWLCQRDWLDSTTVAPSRMLTGAVALFTAMLDVGGVEAMLSALGGSNGGGSNGGDPVPTIEELWRSEHPRTGELLAEIGAHSPDKRIAKAARRAAFKLNSRAG